MDEVSSFSNKLCSRNYVWSKIILYGIFYDISVNFLCIYPMLYTGCMCDVTYIGVYSTSLHGKCILSTLYSNTICLASTHSMRLCVCLELKCLCNKTSTSWWEWTVPKTMVLSILCTCCIRNKLIYDIEMYIYSIYKKYIHYRSVCPLVI
jgi:hypothetical protein